MNTLTAFFDALSVLGKRHGLSPKVIEDLNRVVQEHFQNNTAHTEHEDAALIQTMHDDSQTDVDLQAVPITVATDLQAVEPESSIAWLISSGKTGTIRLANTEEYDLSELIGEGGMGKVYRVRDTRLNRPMALKVLRVDRMEPSVVSRFVEEAQVTAQLQHPGIVPVHQLGQLEDGRVFFTMPEVQGETLSTGIADLHQASMNGEWRTGQRGWTLRRLLSVFTQVCDAVAYAHSRSVIHRDLKPTNIMVGSHGEVRVLDWGIAKVLGTLGTVPSANAFGPLSTTRSKSKDNTLFGSIIGTLSYMSPEQAAGNAEGLDARCDVFALGAVLYEILTGSAPFTGNAPAILYARSKGPPSLTDTVTGGRPALPDGLAEICERAMASDRDERYANAGTLGQDVTDWLDGVLRRERALHLTEKADEDFVNAEGMAAKANQLAERGEASICKVPLWAPESEKAQGWAKLDQADAMRQHASMVVLGAKMLLRTALTHDPHLLEAHMALAQRYRKEHQAADAALDAESAFRAEVNLRGQLENIPHGTDGRDELTCYLTGEGHLTLITDPPGLSATLFRYETRNRRRVEVYDRDLGLTPLNEIVLPMGSYVLKLQGPGLSMTRYPFLIERQRHWDGIPPEETSPQAIPVPSQGSLDVDEVYVPAGWFWSGGDAKAPEPLKRRLLWCDAFIMSRFPVTNRSFLVFLNELVDEGKIEAALRFAPRERGGTAATHGPLIYGRDRHGRFELVPDNDGDLWSPDWPVVMVNHDGAMAYAEWLAKKTDKEWSLPPELTWEKAARGVDGRCFPWGNFLDPSWCCMGQSHPDRPLLAEVYQHQTDRSPYGLRGMAGNVRDLCADVFTDGGPALNGGRVNLDPLAPTHDSLTVLRGGAWGSDPRDCRSANRSFVLPGDRQPAVGFRLFRPYSTE